MATTISVPSSGYGSPYLDFLILGGKWTGSPITYFFSAGPNPSDPNHPANWTDAKKDAFRTALDLVESFTLLEFTPAATKNGANFVWAQWSNSQIGSGILGQHEVPPGGSQLEGEFNYQQSSWNDLTQGSYGFITIMHELGHGLGLDHPHDGDQRFPGVSNSSDTGDFGLNQGIWTTMTYLDGWDQVPPDPDPAKQDTYGWQGTFMAFDIAALQALYGVNNDYNPDNDEYLLPTVNAAGTFWSCIWDAGGADTISNAGSDIGCIINLNAATLANGDPNAGGFVSYDAGIRGGFTIANGVIIENATGGNAGDTLIGNAVANTLTGGDGNDFLDGRAGPDSMIGGAGNDSYIVDDLDDLVTELDDEGFDIVRSFIAYVGALDNIESYVQMDGSWILGDDLNNVLVGNASANTIDGMGGADQMTGGAGDDTYYVDQAGDRVIESLNQGTDTVYVLVNFTFTLSANVENLFLIGSALNANGNSSANSLTGNDAANLLDGKAGIDTLFGLDGDDTYIVTAGDVVTEADSAGIDTIRSSLSFVLPDNVENLILTGTSSVNATGNLLPNALTGNTGANILDGGQGADTMIGLAGSDTYFVDDAGDQAIEVAGGGTDMVKSAITLAALFDNVEKLLLLGTDNLDGTGNGMNNTITGNAGNNRLDGGFGNDTMIGGLGDDTYVVDATGDKITEVFNAGTDTVEATVSFTLATYVENLTLTGANPTNGTGSSAANVITGNDAANILDGRAGADTLFGGDGDDTFILDNLGDSVTEGLSHGTDTIKSSVAHTLEGNVENLILTGSGAISATGNDLDNALTGNNAANVLDGRLGADKMSGLSGNDTYIVDDLGDVVTELSASGGTDTVKASVSHTLGPNVERLTLTGADAIDGSGNTLANILIGNDAANKLSGLAGNDTLQGGKGGDTLTGGVGSDILTGGEDADIFHFDLLAEKGDTITDFLSGTDHIEIVAAGFLGAVAGVVNLASNATPAPTTTAGWFLFDTDNGRLSWDDDGTGAHAAQLLATLTSLPHVLTAADLWVV